MYILKNARKYFNVYLLGYRYDKEVIKYFNDPYKNAIKNLFKDGYPVDEEYDKLYEEYKRKYTPLNNEEISYFQSNHLRKTTYITELISIKEILLQEDKVNLTSYILIMDTKNNEFESYLKNKLSIFSFHSDILSKEIKRINPVYNAVVLRKFVKFLEEKLIFKYINNFDVKNFVPNIETMNKYRNKLDKIEFNNHYNLMTKIDQEISSIKALNLKKNKTEKLKPRIEYSSYNKIAKIHKILHNIRIYCNNIIHFDPNQEVKFNLDESIFQNNITEKNENLINFSKNEIINEEEENISKSYIVDLSKVIDYIANANIPNKLLDELTKLKESYDSSFSLKYDDFGNDDIAKKIKSFNVNKKCREDIISYSNNIHKVMDEVGVPNFMYNFKKNEMKRIIDYINANKFNYEKIDIDEPTRNEKKYLSILDRELKNLDIYSRIKFNLNFESYIKLVELKGEIDNAKNAIEIVDDFVADIEKLNLKTIEKMDELKGKISLINDCLFIFDYSKLFKEITVEEFANYIKNLFIDEKIDLFSKEINNIYLYIYLLKKNLFNEIAYKSIVESIED